MNPSTPVPEVTREELHFRRIDMHGYRRSDGRYEVEGRVSDRKPFEFKSPNGFKRVPPGEAIHDMGVRIVFDDDMVVHEVTTFTDSAPYADCFDAGGALQELKGLRMASGWGSEVRRRFSGSRTCAHLKELLLPMATVAYQSLTMLRAARPDALDAEGRPAKVDSCYAYAHERDLVKRVWPAWWKAAVD
jgi:hypothetical protein